MTEQLEAAAAAAPPATATPEGAAQNNDLLGTAPADPMHIPHAVPAAQVHHATDPQVHHNQHPNTPPVQPVPAEVKTDSPVQVIERVQPSHSDPVPPKKKYAWQKHKAARKA